MGSDNLFHKRRERGKKNLERKKAKREPYDRVLIVCEGEKTEPNYFRDLIIANRINSANVEIDGSCGSSPISVWQHALETYKSEQRKGDPYDRVYCVIDRDSHQSYRRVLEQASRMRPSNTFFVIPSIPCFEYWILLHFDYRTKPYSGAQTGSPCESLIDELKGFLPEYEKGASGLYNLIAAQTDYAIHNSQRAIQHARDTGTEEPTTYVHELVAYLRKLKKKSDSKD